MSGKLNLNSVYLFSLCSHVPKYNNRVLSSRYKLLFHSCITKGCDFVPEDKQNKSGKGNIVQKIFKADKNMGNVYVRLLFG